jgi:ABC-2 type transport system ATP-binding protein
VALAGLTLEVARGEIFGLLGPNGAGKSTAFQILTGLLSADAGRLTLAGEEVSPLDARFRARLGVVFQQPSLDGKLTGRENLELGAALYGVPRAAARARIARSLELFELSDRAGEAVERYSGGMRRRLELARVLLHDPEILIMDEPSQGLDQASLRRFWERLQAIRAERKLTVLVTTHQPEEAEQCDRLAVLDAGRIIAQGTPEELKRRVGGDVIAIEAARPEEVAAGVREAFGLPAVVAGGRVVIEVQRAHEVIPRIVERFPGLASVGMRPPSLADVFVKLTGRALREGN